MFVRWKDRATPSRQISCGGSPVMSRPFRRTVPEPGRPGPVGPMLAQMERGGTTSVTPPTAWKPANALRTSRTSSTPRPFEPADQAPQGAHDAAGEQEEQGDQEDPQDERPVFRVRGDLLVEDDQDQRADRGPVEGPHATEDRHDEHVRGLRPVGEVGEDAAVEDPEEAARD